MIMFLHVHATYLDITTVNLDITECNVGKDGISRLGSTVFGSGGSSETAARFIRSNCANDWNMCSDCVCLDTV